MSINEKYRQSSRWLDANEDLEYKIAIDVETLGKLISRECK
jgi:hypothetical protein